MYKFGLKLWSINKNYIDTAKKLYDENIYDYIELYAIPSSFDEYAHIWKSLNIPYIIHAPHFMHGINFSSKEKLQDNMKLAYEALKYADYLNADKVIFHPGIKGDYKETARQIKMINDERILIENKPYYVAVETENLSLNDVCVGYNPEQIKYIMQESGAGLCLDIGHGICAANSLHIDYVSFLKEFISLNPAMFHISDGDINDTQDKHYNIGKGTFDFNIIFSLIPENAVISVETAKSSKDNLDDFIEDMKLLHSFCKSKKKVY